MGRGASNSMSRRSRDRAGVSLTAARGQRRSTWPVGSHHHDVSPSSRDQKWQIGFEALCPQERLHSGYERTPWMTLGMSSPKIILSEARAS